MPNLKTLNAYFLTYLPINIAPTAVTPYFTMKYTAILEVAPSVNLVNNVVT